ncbi:MAG: adenosylcobinamide-phosphate synthase CbiB [Marinobacter sp.]|uniref:adenosylcobinamide-phosphate synthase CbiB n=1 Tax=Marinobacter sp. TaxID=50741 RepID=UPI0034A049A2
MGSVLVCVAAVGVDYCLGEPRRWHPLVAFGRQAERIERKLNTPSGQSVGQGALAVALMTGPPVLLAVLLMFWLPTGALWVVSVLVVWLALSLRGLTEHARAVEYPLRAGAIELARTQVGRIVSRKAEALDESGVATAATESVLENGADAVFATIFWFLVAGIPGVVLHRAVNTLDAMWGYRNERLLTFGRVAALLDDALNWIPARLTALTYALTGRTRTAFHCWQNQAHLWDSPNAGPVMASGAGALRVTLGGPAPYTGGIKQRPLLGTGPKASSFTIDQAISLVRRGVFLWLATLLVLAVLFGGLS